MVSRTCLSAFKLPWPIFRREDLCTNLNPFADVCSDPDEGGLVLTNEIFINTIDNPVYDTVGGTGFAAFGKVTPDTMEGEFK